MTHLPGPYVVHVDKSGGDWTYTIRTAEPTLPGGLGKCVATVNPHIEARFPGTAAMLAAADELLEALKILLVQVGPYQDGQGAAMFHAQNIARDAIAKAEQA